jgi:hypothetical protein
VGSAGEDARVVLGLPGGAASPASPITCQEYSAEAVISMEW